MSTADLVYALAWPPSFTALAAPVFRACLPGTSWAVAVAHCWMCGGVGVVLGFAAGDPWPCAVIGAAHVAVGVWLWRRGRRGRRRVPRAYGAKSRALVAAVVAKARQAARPRPVLRPVPGAAR